MSAKDPLRAARPLLAGSASSYGATSSATHRNGENATESPSAPPANRRKRAWSLHEAASLIGDPDINPESSLSASLLKSKQSHENGDKSKAAGSRGGKGTSPLYIIVYALVNVIISVPGLYGYAAVM